AGLRPLRVVDVAGVEVGPHVIVARELVRKLAGPAAEVQGAQPVARPQVAADDRADGLEVVLQDAAEEDEQDRMVRDLLHEPGEEAHVRTAVRRGRGARARRGSRRY